MRLIKSEQVKQADAVSLWIFNILGLAIAAIATVTAIIRVFELVGDKPVTVPVSFSGQNAEVLPQPGAETVTVNLEGADLTVDNLPALGIAAGIGEAVVLAATIVTVIICLLRLSIRVTHGQIFGKSSTRLVSGAGITALVGITISHVLGGMVGAEALLVASDDFPSVTMANVEVFPFVLAGFVIALISTVFVIGDRLQRETEGLV